VKNGLWLAAGMTVVAACSSESGPDEGGDELVLTVLPADTIIPIFGTAEYTVVATNRAGDTVPTPSVVWTSSDSGVAGITQDGLADGRTAGTTNIVATAGAVSSEPAQLQVSASAAPCFGITAATKFTGSVQWGYIAVDAETDGGFFITADDNGNVSAEMTSQGNGPFLFMWTGPLGGASSASVTQKKTDGVGGQSTYTSISGVIQPQPAPSGLPKLTLIVDASTCQYSLTTGASLSTLLTDFFGNQINSIDITAFIQFAGTVPADWRTNGLAKANGVIMANSVAYAGLHREEDVLAPLGFVPELFNAPAPGSVGQASGGFAVTYSP
jgi:hypothetical protein